MILVQAALSLLLLLHNNQLRQLIYGTLSNVVNKEPVHIHFSFVFLKAESLILLKVTGQNLMRTFLFVD